MLPRCLIAACAFLLSSYAHAQQLPDENHLVDEKHIEVKLRAGVSHLSVPIRGLQSVYRARIKVQWLSPDGIAGTTLERKIEVPPGGFVFETPLALPAQDPLVARLRYRLTPEAENITAFADQSGIVAFTEIANFAYVLSVTTAPASGPSEPVDVYVVARNPKTGMPMADVLLSVGHAKVKTAADGSATIRLSEQDREKLKDNTLTASLGDLIQQGELPMLAGWPVVKVSTDKRLYRPGQTLHMRIFALRSDGHAAAKEACSLTVSNQQAEIVFQADLKSSKFGIAHADWEIPAHSSSGEFEIKSDCDDVAGTAHVQIRQYELPSFRVLAEPDEPFYLPGAKPSVTIHADYLFGKAMTAGHVRISQPSTTNVTPAHELPVAEGDLDGHGQFIANLKAVDDVLPLSAQTQFEDLHFVASVTDKSTNRTEQTPFDIRVSGQGIHIYTSAISSISAFGTPAYITVFSPDGKPLIASVDVLSGQRVIQTARTNRFGIAKIIIQQVDDISAIRAKSGSFQATMPWEISQQDRGDDDRGNRRGNSQEFQIKTDQALYAPGRPIRINIRSLHAPVSGRLLVWRGSQLLFSRPVSGIGNETELSLPYDARFSGKIIIAFNSSFKPAYHAIVFPEAVPFTVAIRSPKSSYKPGDIVPLLLTARNNSGKPVEAAFGVSIVDAAVNQRATVDDRFSRPRYWDFYGYQNVPRYGGFSVEDLPLIDPRKVDADVQLAAEALLAGSEVHNDEDNLRELLASAFVKPYPISGPIQNSLNPTLRFPMNEAELDAAMPEWRKSRDPWGTAYRPVFGIENTDRVIHWMSAGPDKLFDTGDDLELSASRMNWFDPFSNLVTKTLDNHLDLPSTAGEVYRMLDASGIDVANVRDPWGTPLRVKIYHGQASRFVNIESAGPDHKFDTPDDVMVQQIQGTWFREMGGKLEAAVEAAPKFPRTDDEFRKAAATAGIDFYALLDPWGHRYYVKFSEADRYENRVRVFTQAEYGSAAQQRRILEPITVHVLKIDVYTSGEDGVAGTYDDAVVATFEHKNAPPATPSALASPDSPSSNPQQPPGTGTLTGIVLDRTGAPIQNVAVTMDGKYAAKGGADGLYSFFGVPSGFHSLVMESPGFQRFYLSGVPVEGGRITRADAVLDVGNVSQSVEVRAAAPALQTEQAQILTETPRVRNYFAETLLWAPELLTDKSGNARLPVKLADNITTWNVTVSASTIDGDTSEAQMDLRAILPFFADVDPPPILTVGDEVSVPIVVRNYTDAEQRIGLAISTPAQLSAVSLPPKQQTIARQETLSVPLTVRATASSAAAPLRIVAQSQKHNDAIERSVAIHPNGRFFERTANDSLANPKLQISVPQSVIAGSLHAELKFYPSVLATVIESLKSLIQEPHGCAEQTISSAYPNLFLLKLVAQSNLKEPKLAADALKNLTEGYTLLLNYRDVSGGFSYWTGQKPDLALTAYATDFLREASSFVKIDGGVIARAQAWMRSQTPTEAALASLQINALVALGPSGEADVLARLGKLGRQAQESDDPYAIASFVLAAISSHHAGAAEPAVHHLLALASQEEGLVYWALRKNTPYYGYGKSGRIETTALAIDALQQWQASSHTSEAQDITDRALLFLRQHGSHSYWYSTQPTVRVLRVLTNVVDFKSSADPFEAQIQVNGATVSKLLVPGGTKVTGPVSVEISEYMKSGASNEVRIVAPKGHSLVQTQLAVSWYESWSGNVTSPEISVRADFSTLSPAPNGLVRCDVLTERPDFQGYGMLIAEVGLPPASEVDRAALTDLLQDGVIDQFEVQPDRLVFYLWPTAGQKKFSFFFRPRLTMDAKTAATEIFDYYNPDIRAIQAPQMFKVR